MDARDQETQCASFLHTLGEEGLEKYDTFTFAEIEESEMGFLITKFEAYCSPIKNVT